MAQIVVPTYLEDIWMRSIDVYLYFRGDLKPYAHIHYDNPNKKDNRAYIGSAWQGLDFEFTITYSSVTSENKGEFVFYNLDTDTIVNIDTQTRIQVIAGYKYGMPALVFEGRVEKYYVDLRSCDTKLTLKCTSVLIGGFTHVNNIQIESIEREQIIEFVERVIGKSKDVFDREIIIGEIVNPNELYDTDIFLMNGEKYNSTPYQILFSMKEKIEVLYSNVLTRDIDYMMAHKYVEGLSSWTFYDTIVNNKVLVNFVPRTHISSEPMIILTTRTGLLQFEPNDILDAAAGWTIKCMFNPFVSTGRKIRVAPNPAQSYALHYAERIIQSKYEALYKEYQKNFSWKRGDYIMISPIWDPVKIKDMIKKMNELMKWYKKSKEKITALTVHVDTFTHTLNENEFYTTIKCRDPDEIASGRVGVLD